MVHIHVKSLVKHREQRSCSVPLTMQPAGRAERAGSFTQTLSHGSVSLSSCSRSHYSNGWKYAASMIEYSCTARKNNVLENSNSRRLSCRQCRQHSHITNSEIQNKITCPKKSRKLNTRQTSGFRYGHVTLQSLAAGYRRFGTTYRSHYFNTCTVHLSLLCTMTNKCTIISQIITLPHVSTWTG